MILKIAMSSLVVVPRVKMINNTSAAAAAEASFNKNSYTTKTNSQSNFLIAASPLIQTMISFKTIKMKFG